MTFIDLQCCAHYTWTVAARERSWLWPGIFWPVWVIYNTLPNIVIMVISKTQDVTCVILIGEFGFYYLSSSNKLWVGWVSVSPFAVFIVTTWWLICEIILFYLCGYSGQVIWSTSVNWFDFGDIWICLLDR